MKVSRSIEFDAEEREEMIVNAAKVEAEKHLGKLADDEEWGVEVRSYCIDVRVCKKRPPANEPQREPCGTPQGMENAF
jgi:hypothetical protein